MKRIIAGLVVSFSLAAAAGCSGETKPPKGDKEPNAPAIEATPKAHDLKIHIVGTKKAVVWQNAQTEIDMTVVRLSEFSLMSNEPSLYLALTGKFQGDVKLSAEVVKGGKGLTVRFDPETVKGSDNKSMLKIKADEDADLGVVEVKMTATTSDGKTTAPVTLPVYVEKKK